ncbi:retrovirus-related pol polyprotein from transposon TNT 1-94 [Tanacetum coccineum]
MDDYSQFTCVKFLASKDEAPDFIIKFLKMIQVRLNATLRNIRINNGTEFVNQTLCSYYESVGISHETSVACTPQQNGVIERRNHTLVEAARTMLIYAKAPLFLWVEAVATACYTQNRSNIRRLHGKTPYELLHDRKPDISYLHVFGALCYLNNDSEDLGKLQAKVDIGIFIGYLTTMASEQLGSGPGLQSMTPATSSSGLVTNPIPQQTCDPPKRDDWDRLFQPMFDEYFNPPTILVSPVPVAAAPRVVDLADSPVEILNICPRIPGQEFNEPPSEEEAQSFIRELGHHREIKYITDVIVDHCIKPSTMENYCINHQEMSLWKGIWP